MKRISPTLKAGIPPPEAGWFELRYAILADGSLALIRATHDVWSEHRKRREMMAAGFRGSFPPLFPPETRARLSVFDGTTETVAFQFELDSPYLLFDRLGAKSWLVAAARCRIGESNARIFDEQGSITRAFCVGDGIKKIQCDSGSNIWVGYFDEGVFGNVGWKPDNSLKEIVLGVNRFDEHGRMTWAHVDDHRIADCYTMNVAPDAVWVCYYSDFPILRVGYDGSSRLWENDKSGADLLAVSDRHIVLLGGYSEQSRLGSLLRLTEGGTETVGEFEFDFHGLEPRSLSYHGARGDKMHFVHNNEWYVLSVNDMARELS